MQLSGGSQHFAEQSPGNSGEKGNNVSLKDRAMTYEQHQSSIKRHLDRIATASVATGFKRQEIQ